MCVLCCSLRVERCSRFAVRCVLLWLVVCKLFIGVCCCVSCCVSCVGVVCVRGVLCW